jgi:hypothetical protein
MFLAFCRACLAHTASPSRYRVHPSTPAGPTARRSHHHHPNHRNHCMIVISTLESSRELSLKARVLAGKKRGRQLQRKTFSALSSSSLAFPRTLTASLSVHLVSFNFNNSLLLSQHLHSVVVASILSRLILSRHFFSNHVQQKQLQRSLTHQDG